MPSVFWLVKRFVVLFLWHYIFGLIRLVSQFSVTGSKVSTFTRSVMSSRPWVE